MDDEGNPANTGILQERAEANAKLQYVYKRNKGYNIRGMKIYRWEVPKKCTNTHENIHEKGKTHCVDCWGRYACLII